MLDDFLTQIQADELPFYTMYDVDCDDGTFGDVIYVVNERIKQPCLDTTILTDAPRTCRVQ